MGEGSGFNMVVRPNRASALVWPLLCGVDGERSEMAERRNHRAADAGLAVAGHTGAQGAVGEIRHGAGEGEAGAGGAAPLRRRGGGGGGVGKPDRRDGVQVAVDPPRVLTRHGVKGHSLARGWQHENEMAAPSAVGVGGAITKHTADGCVPLCLHLGRTLSGSRLPVPVPACAHRRSFFSRRTSAPRSLVRGRGGFG